MALYHSKSKTKHTRRLITYEIFLGVEKSLQTLILQAVDEPFVEALKEEYIGYGRLMPHETILNLQTKISKVTSKHKFNLKRELFVAWEQLQVLLAYFKEVENAKKQFTKWNVSVLDGGIIIHVVDQMNESDWFSEEMMIK